jgi:hypothetical protein
MEKNRNDILSVISDAAGLTFAVQKEWKPLPTINLAALDGFAVIGNMVSSGAVYFLLRDMNPLSWEKDSYKLLKISVGEETGIVELFTMELNAAEAEYIRTNNLELWEN